MEKGKRWDNDIQFGKGMFTLIEISRFNINAQRGKYGSGKLNKIIHKNNQQQIYIIEK